jgi:hypothetical protein
VLGILLLRPPMLPPGLVTRCQEQNLDAVSVLRSRGVCLLSPDNTEAILTQWPTRLNSLLLDLIKLRDYAAGDLSRKKMP